MAEEDELDTGTFEHLPLDQSTTSVRTVIVSPTLRDGFIDCQLAHTSTDSTYTAVSYTWGSSIIGQFILLNSKLFNVKQNLWDFLNTARSKLANEPLWIDAICCNQNDNAERTHQVQHMGDIFKNARRVIAYLHPIEGLTVSLLDSVKSVYKEDSSVLAQSEVDRKTRLRSLLIAHGSAHNYVANVYDFTHPFVGEVKLLASHEYWTRMWCVQEVILAKDLLFMYGTVTLPWHSILSCVQDLLGTSMTEQIVFRRPVPKGFETVFEHVDWYSIYSSLNKINSFLLKRHEFNSPNEETVKAEVTSLLWEFGDYACSDFRDRIFSLQSLTADEIPISYDYDFVDLYYAMLACFGCDTPDMLTVQTFKALELSPADLVAAAQECAHKPRRNAFMLQQSSLAPQFFTASTRLTLPKPYDLSMNGQGVDPGYGQLASFYDWDYYYACPVCYMTIPRIAGMDARHDVYVCLNSKKTPDSHLVFLHSQNEDPDGFFVVHFIGSERVSRGCQSLAR